jgi:lipoprotein-releasing system ATP-binding protein
MPGRYSMIIEASGVSKSYGNLKVLKGIDLSVRQGEVVSVVGASGAGKSTLLHILGTLDRADAGRLTVHGTTVGGLSSRRLAAFRNRHIGFVFQFHHLLPEFTAIENVMMPGLIGGRSREEAGQKALHLLALLNLESRASHRPSELSGGEQQRVAVARALINEPAVVFADEPSGNLDSVNAEALHALFFDLRKQLNQTFVIATHNESLADRSDRKLVMKDGTLID